MKTGVLAAAEGTAVADGPSPTTKYAARLIAALQVSPFDPLTFSAVAAFLVLIAFLASYVPARRATRVHPVGALRGE